MKIGLCLSGGGVKGAAHIGAIKAFEEENIEFDCFSGTSSGSIVATLAACGYTSTEMYDLFQKYGKSITKIDWKNILKIILGVITKRKLIITGLNSGESIEKIVDRSCRQKNIQNINQIKKQLLIPTIDSQTGMIFTFNSCDLNIETKEEKFISDILISKAVRASCSYPVVFSPFPYKDTFLLDGGIKQNIPWNELKLINCDKIISIGFKNKYEKKCCKNIIDIAERSFELMCDELNRHEIERIDFLHIIHLENVSLLEIKKIKEIYEQGYRQTKESMYKIKKYLEL